MLNTCGCFYFVVFCDSLERLGRYVHTYLNAFSVAVPLTLCVMCVHICVLMYCAFSGLSVLLQLTESSEREVASLKAHRELEVGELNVRVRELSHQLQQANSSGGASAPLLATVTTQHGGAVDEGRPIAKRTRRRRRWARDTSCIVTSSR